jgi:AcrR family transcriptional regulator
MSAPEGTARAPRGGTRRVPRPVREEQILEVACSTFAERGYHGASMDLIAKRTGVSKPILYSYFRSKQGLYLKSVERAGGELIARMRAAGPLEADPETRMRAGVDEFFRFVEEERDAYSVLYAEATALGEPVARQVAELRGRLAGTVEALLASSEHADERLPADALAGVAHALVGAGESLANWWLDHPQTPRESLVRWLTGLAWAGLSAAAQEPPLGRATRR